jgi:hypothetical protein
VPLPIHLVVTCRCGRRPAAWIRQTVTVFPDGPTATLRLACLRCQGRPKTDPFSTVEN